ncbi:beta-N-acetylhexosaminidase [Tranquillimonas alkanivorans]|uniref:beta-N-acetylhexosaminidase n=1 Tax=Tranquillimonas alkanivorans TaxID=441119 RepID=A0A1I5R7I2_9RHOB|nr:beta-N-acetylhexosaminidase [Tranquillimonas alkanivorans]SFP54482.1 beta-N-acetylhexosaminidase [Tranquillimonas alkanivorans]
MAGQGAHILAPEGLSLSASERAFFAQADPWGFIVFARNIAHPEQLRRLTGELREAVGRDAPILIDQEGGRVQRLGPPYWRAWLPPLDQVRQAGEGAARSMYLRGRLIAEELRDVGIDVNCAPLSDVACDLTHPFLKNRCYGDTPEAVIAASRAITDGMAAGGVLPVLKHIPGHGRGEVDSHLGLPVVEASREELEAVDFAPFRALNDLPLGMTAHITYAALDDRPATQSSYVIRLIRDRIGFDGLLMTDDISMEALGGSIAERSRLSLDAGCDVILHCNGEMAEMEAVVAEAGRMTPRAQARADRALAARAAAQPFDAAEAEAELAALLEGGA